ncbi:LysR family transcriptional regulator [Novosphingobium flavum]|uniref:LysR family transcriptional regulator n=1 Tax=Novosphingobium flavum TaxID=1778672 RepID=A0A7X1KLV7_9SPHN|nr:LysR substrate-binding domain-containing protein [Novosphingobium flavum]MBC2665996.1 LysR family transcriptional regulator [Novosphingobium flavum]
MHEKSDQIQIEAISFKQLKLFESIGRLNSVRRASEDCNLSQPAVTQALAKFEALVGARLVERRASGSYLNPAGELLYRRVARFTERLESALFQFGVEGAMPGAKIVANRLLRSQVRALIAIVDLGSFQAAADALGLSLATLQRAARDLEGNLRKSLFYRTAAGALPTIEAIQLGQQLKLCLQEIEWGVQELHEALGDGAAQITVGAMPLGGNVLLASVLDRFLRQEPRVQVVVRNEGAFELIRRLGVGDVDLVVGLLPGKVEPGLTRTPLASTPYSIVAREGHPLLSRSAITLDDLADHEWLVGGPGSSRRACFDQLFAGHRPAWAPVATSALPVIRHLIERSDRLTLMTSYEIAQEPPGLARLDYGPIRPTPEIGVTMRDDWLPTRAHAAFLDLLRETVCNEMPGLLPMQEQSRRAA